MPSAAATPFSGDDDAYDVHTTPHSAPPLLPRPRDHPSHDHRSDSANQDASRPVMFPRTSSDWSTPSAAESEPTANGKRASVAGFDAEMLQSIRPARALVMSGAHTYDSSSWRARAGASRSLARGMSYNDSDSEGSHYDDDDETASQDRRHGPYSAEPQADDDPAPWRPGPSSADIVSTDAEPLSTADGNAGDSNSDTKSYGLRYGLHSEGAGETVGANSGVGNGRDAGLASPAVPQRTSSFQREDDPTTLDTSLAAPGWMSPIDDPDRVGPSSAGLSRRPSLGVQNPQIPLRRSSSEIRRLSDYPGRHGRASTETIELREGLGLSLSPFDSSGERRQATYGLESSRRGLYREAAARSSVAASGADEAVPAQTPSHGREVSEHEGAAKPSSRGEALQAVNEDHSVDSVRSGANKLPSPQRRSSKGSTTTSELDPEEQARLERELLAGEGSDGPRPKTLKEAREKARLRRQQSEAASAPQTSSPAREAGRAHAAGLSTDDALSRASVDSIDRPYRDPRRLSSREVPSLSRKSTSSEFSAPSDYSHGSEADDLGAPSSSVDGRGGVSHDDAYGGMPSGAEGAAVAAAIASYDAGGGIEELTAAVSSAMQDLSFSSADDSTNTVYGAEAPQTPAQTIEAGHRAFDHELQTPKATSTSRFDNARLSSTQTAAPTAQKALRGGKNGLASPYAERSNAAASNSLQGVMRQKASTETARSLPVISPIEVYGKTVPFPACFGSATITAKKKAAPWERARSYAMFTNELLALQTGLELWMDAVQRPAKRQQIGRQSQDALSGQDEHPFRGGHVRNEGSYAASVRSDLTFPMRGDGGKAKEIVSSLPSMPESPPSRLPANIPYPALLDHRPHAPGALTSAASGGQIQRGLDVGSPQMVGRSNGLTASSSGNSRSVTGGNFFSSLGRKGSRRAPGSSVSSLAQGGLATIAGAVGGPRAHKVKGKTISAPIQAVAERCSMDAMDLGSPDSGFGGRTSSLGESTSAGRLPAVAERQHLANIVTSPGGSRPSPMGPRPPGSGGSAGFFSSLGRSGSSDVARGSAGSGQASPATAQLASRGAGDASLSPQISSPDFEQGWSNDANPRPRNLRSGSSASLLGSRDSTLSAVRSSFSYGTVRERIRGIGPNSPEATASVATTDAAFQEALNKLSDVLPDADRATLAHYLEKAKGNDLLAIGDYLQDQSLGRLPG
ncbi:hypothetical protein ACQY0O_004217 [Thecaphora frezii]